MNEWRMNGGWMDGSMDGGLKVDGGYMIND
jgi:hypothetical protein